MTQITEKKTGADALRYAANDGDLTVPALAFVKPEKTFASFAPEYAVDNGDLVFHFFLPEQLQPFADRGDVVSYWKDKFPRVLDPVTREHFAAEYPRIRAAYVDDYGVNSWWMRATGFGDTLLDADSFVNRFYERLEKELNSKPT